MTMTLAMEVAKKAPICMRKVIYHKVSRIEAISEQLDTHMQLDVNIEIYPLHVGEKFMMVLASTLNLDGTPDSCYYTQTATRSSFLLVADGCCLLVCCSCWFAAAGLLLLPLS
ncbi:DNA-directed RNA polymerases II and V subunit 8A-like [Camellia sinensis]|uniref:DNA-directed RNA polymerases II and V subunit 8A-like n=1 Tax=Camellia sinensis TaxID=4442 RepID=UPI00103608C7|nr:DNA-directed RNA polymerases II and V subunit 8A-like [Camellia sinensis]